MLKILKKIFPILFFLIAGTHTSAQDNHLSSRKGESSFGIGIGMSYGSMGIRLGTNLLDNLNLFGGLGCSYQIGELWYNLGILKDFKSKSSTQFYLIGMYGTNAAIKIKDLSEYDNVYKGITLGIGIKVNSRETKGNFFDFGILSTLESSSYKKDKKTVENDPRVVVNDKRWPVIITFGYNFNL